VNSSLISGIFPDKLKIAKILPVLKKGDSEDFSSYRPVSLLPIFSKIYERVVYRQLMDFLELNHILDQDQHGFQRGKSTVTALTNFVSSIIDSVDKGEKTVGIFMDLSRAFDSVSHPVLIDTLNSIGLNQGALNWFKSYLNNRQQFVEIRHCSKGGKLTNFSSTLQKIKYGVPQGSILGPLLFLCYLKGLPQIVTQRSKICLYADDANLLVSSDSISTLEVSSFINICLN